MRSIVIIVLFGLVPCVVMPQNADRLQQAAEVKKAIGQIAATKKTNAHIILRDLREFDGNVTEVDADSFGVNFKPKKKGWFTKGTNSNSKPASVLKYNDVLQLEGNELLLSFVPNPTQSPYASWDAIRAIGIGEFLQVHLTNGRKSHGVFLKSVDDRLTLMRGNTEFYISREVISRVYRVKDNTVNLASKLLRGGQKGTEVSDDIFPILDPTARAYPGALAIGAAAGGSIYALPKAGTKRVLVFAK